MNNNLSDLISATAEKAKIALNNNSVLGDPVTANGTMVIPVFKLSFGFAGGGFDEAGKNQSLLGGAGAGVTKTPSSYIIINDEGVSVVSAEQENKPDILSIAIPLILEKLKNRKKDK